MIKTCILIFVLLPFDFSLCVTTKYTEDYAAHDAANQNIPNDNLKVRDHPKNLKKVLNDLHSLLRDPVDEEHDDCDESSATHADEWTIQMHKDDENTVRDLAESYGFSFHSKVEVGDGVYRFLTKKHVSRDSDTDEETVDAQRESKNEKREEKTHNNEKRESLLRELTKRLGDDDRVLWYKRERILKREKRVPFEDIFANHKLPVPNRDITMNDPQFKNQWYIRNDGQTTGPERFDSNIVPVWNMGYTGKDVSISVLDDGMDHTHPDLQDNYDPKASKDLNGHDDDPLPNDSDPYNAHGTKCSGTIAAKANNSLCGTGIAYNSNIGAIRMLDGRATDGLEADALSFHRNHIDIYSCSWGPKDNGKTFGRPGKLGQIAFAQGAKFGRNGKGSLFVWATGNGGRSMDDCNADGYVNNIYTMGIGSVNEHGVSTYYGERCSAMFAVTYCSGRHSSSAFGKNAHADVITTYLHHQCTKHFVGTSSAAPLAAGIMALVIEANRNLTWRDMQHLLFHTTIITSPLDPDWQVNGCGKHVNHKFGFGLIDAFRMVNAALNWKTVAPQRKCHFKLNFNNGDIPSRRHFKLNFTTDGCQSCQKKEKDGKCKHGITKLEHVVVEVTLKHRRRGDLSIELISPSGTDSYLLHSRIYDSSSAGLKGWKFMTVFNWCENPKGTWQLIFRDNEPTRKRSTRDYEQVYMNYLDTKKKKRAQGNKRTEQHDAMEEKKKKKEFSLGDMSGEEKDDSSPSVNAEEQTYDTPSKKSVKSDTTKKSAVDSGDLVKDAKRLLDIISKVQSKSQEKRDVSENTVDDTKDEKVADNMKNVADNDAYFNDNSYRREEPVDVNDGYRSENYRRDEEIDDYNFYKRRRKRRETVKKFDIDERAEKRFQHPVDDIVYEDPVLKKSILAGEVQKISVTFYGTA